MSNLFAARNPTGDLWSICNSERIICTLLPSGEALDAIAEALGVEEAHLEESPPSIWQATFNAAVGHTAMVLTQAMDMDSTQVQEQLAKADERIEVLLKQQDADRLRNDIVVCEREYIQERNRMVRVLEEANCLEGAVAPLNKHMNECSIGVKLAKLRSQQNE